MKSRSRIRIFGCSVFGHVAIVGLIVLHPAFRDDCSRFLGGVQVLQLALLAGEWHVFHAVVAGHRGGAAEPWILCFEVAMALTLWSFLRTSFTDPGTQASPEWRSWLSSPRSGAAAAANAAHEVQTLAPRGKRTVEEDNSEDEVGEQCLLGGRPWYCTASTPRLDSSTELRRRCFRPGKITWCQSCDGPRPERAHHCRHCGVCVLRMDHHCPMVGNCVGWRNHKFFILLLFWQLVSCVSFLACPGGPGAQLWHGLPGDDLLAIWPVFAKCFAVVWACALLVITVVMLIRSLPMVLANETSIEANYAGVNPYGRIGWFASFLQIFGSPPLFCLPMLLLPLTPVERGGCSGTAFPTGPGAEGAGGAVVLSPKEHASGTGVFAASAPVADYGSTEKVA
eukprot:TRINITY_DN11478_c0_g4_i2.p1 TRINITY_DN11478_c0_g4~~TRINITY_DN11478_c0_g4_i2.p1  ORF type:complete len:395 (-),score=55.86 TRINITY_DN11478_c0_g4_i2:82-1266(-)